MAQMTTPEQKREALRWLVKGWSNRGAASKAGVSENTVRRWLKEADFTAELEAGLAANEALGKRLYRSHLRTLVMAEIRIATGKEEANSARVSALNNALRRAGVVPIERLEVSGALARMSDAELEAVIASEVARAESEEDGEE